MKKKYAFKTLLILLSFVTIAILEFRIIESYSSASIETGQNQDHELQDLREPINISKAIIRKAAEDKISYIKEEEIKYKVYLIEVLLERYNSPMKGLGRLMYDRTTECGGDYKVVVAIAGNESGFGRIPYKLYNPFGYLDGVQYDSFEHAVDVISCKIAERFLKPCNNDLTCVIRTYGGHDTNREQWISNISYFMSLL